MPNDSSFVPDALKGDLIKLFQTPMWQCLMAAWKQRVMASASFGEQLHTYALVAAYREGFFKAVEELEKIPWQSAEQAKTDGTAAEIESILLSPKD